MQRNGTRMIFRIGMVILLGLLGSPIPAEAQTDAPDDAADQIQQAAFNAQTNGDWKFAADQWERLLKDFPEHPDRAETMFNAGFCHVQLEQFERAADRLSQAIEKLNPERTVLLPQAYLFLGFSEIILAEMAQGDTARKQFESAIAHLDTLIKTFPKFADLDQALFFRAGALEGLERWDDAIAAYEQVLALPKATFQHDARYYLATLYEQSGRFSEALKSYQAFIDQAPEHDAATEARFRIAETWKQMGFQSHEQGDAKTADEQFSRAIEVYQSLESDTGLAWRDEVLFQHAVVLAQTGQYESAAKQFLDVAAIKGSTRASRALMLAGRDLFRAHQDDRAIEVLNQAVQANGPESPAAAHWLAKTYLFHNQFDKAFVIANAWVERTDDSRVQAPLMMDLADAAYGWEDHRQESPDLYLKLVDQHSQHVLAPAALYYAAYAAMEIGHFDRAIELAKRFESNWVQNDYLPDVLEVAGDSHLLKKEPAASAKIFDRLVEQFPQHAKRPGWILRAGLARFQQQQWDSVVQWFDQHQDALTTSDQQAEAAHWSGSALWQAQQLGSAIERLKQSREASTTWRRADQTLLNLARALEEEGQTDPADQAYAGLIEQYAQSPLVAEAHFRRAELAFAQENWTLASQEYDQVIAQHGESYFAPYAVFGQAWTAFKQNEYATAVDLFSRLIDDWPDHERARPAAIARAACLRQSGQVAESEKAARQLLDSESDSLDPATRIDVLYELGLAQIEQKKWTEVIQTFQQLLELEPDGSRTPQFLYELAWAQRGADQKEASNRTFARLIEQQPDSELAAEAHFHLAQDAYTQQNWASAIDHYQQCLSRAQDAALKEKATYKLGWAFYKQEQYDQALTQFRQQTDAFRDGSLYADGLFMVSESLYKQRQHDQAFEAYRVARPVILSSTTVTPEIQFLTRLHGGQCAIAAKKYASAIEFLNEIIQSDSPESLKQDAWLEIGLARSGLGESDAAREAWRRAAKHPGKTGAHARCLLGDAFFQAKEFTEAINQYKLAFYGYGGTAAADDVRPWQAYAVYEAARCHLVQADAADSQPLKRQLKQEAVRWFEYLLEHYPQDRLVDETRRQLERLKKTTP